MKSTNPSEAQRRGTVLPESDTARARRRNVALVTAGALLGAGIAVAGPRVVDGVERVVRGDAVAETYGTFDAYQKMHDQIDPRTSLVIDAALESTGAGKPFDPYRIALEDGSVVTVGIVRNGEDPTSIARNLAPEIADVTDITRLITEQTSPEGNSAEIQPGMPYIIPEQYLGKK